MVFPILPARTPDSGYNIDNSLRVEADDSPKLSKTVSTATNTTKMTLSLWYKLGEPADMAFLSKFADSSNRFHLRIMADGSLLAYNNVSGSYHYKTTTAKLRDYSAFYHIVFSYDTTDGAAADRLKIYLNGTRLTSFVNNTNPSSSEALKIASDTSNPLKVLCSNNEDAYLSGYVSDFYYIDGDNKAPTDFGEVDEDSGIWKPKRYSGGFGNNGFKLEFQQVGVGTASASTVGADTSGNDHHLTSANIAAIDVTTDTPTNNFSTLNSINKFLGCLITKGNLEYDSNSTGGSSVVSTIAPANGKWYVEVKAVTSTIAIGVSEVGLINFNEKGQGASRPNINYAYGGSVTIDEGSADSEASFTTNDIIGLALNLDDGELIIYKNGTALNSGTAYNLHTNTTHGNTGFSVQTHTGSGNTKASFNFGNPAFAISSGNSDGAGFGNFEYAVPSGYYALCTKNLAEYG
jgi:hypothetical protein